MKRQTEKPSPTNVSAEKALLGAILLDNRLFVVAGAIEPDDFSLDSHRLLWSHIAVMVGRGEAADVVTLDRQAPVFGATLMRRVGKKAAGSLLDDREHKAFPVPR